MRTPGLMFFLLLLLVGRLPHLLTPGIGRSPRPKHPFGERYDGATSAFATSLHPSTKQIRRKASLIFQRIAGVNPLWGFGTGPHLAT